MKKCIVCNLGSVPYDVGLTVQERARQLRNRGEIADVLFLLEHPHVFTLGRNAGRENILLAEDVLKQKRIPVVRTGRGGDVTYHGPGQLIGYPILNLKENGLTVSSLVRKLEDVMIDTLGEFCIEAERNPKGRGVFAGDDKIGALGLRIQDAISTHGFALNVNTDLRYFDYIVPCGLKGVKATSIAELLGHDVNMSGVQDAVIRGFATAFGFTVEAGKEEVWLAASPSG